MDDESLAYRQAMWTAWADRGAQVASPDDHVNREIGMRFRRGAPDSPVVVGRTPEQVKIAEACYAGEVSMVDRAVGAVLERLETLGLTDKTMIVAFLEALGTEERLLGPRRELLLPDR